jgi:hypothetical protein
MGAENSTSLSIKKNHKKLDFHNVTYNNFAMNSNLNNIMENEVKMSNNMTDVVNNIMGEAAYNSINFSNSAIKYSPTNLIQPSQNPIHRPIPIKPDNSENLFNFKFEKKTINTDSNKNQSSSSSSIPYYTGIPGLSGFIEIKKSDDQSQKLFSSLPNKGKLNEPKVESNNITDEDIKNEKDVENPKNECTICLCRETKVLLSPCNHLCVCYKCSKDLKECPKCRRSIVNKVKVYLE